MFGKGFNDSVKAAQEKAEQEKREREEKKAAAKETKTLENLESCRVTFADGSSVFVLSLVTLPSTNGPGPSVKELTERIKAAYPGQELTGLDLHYTPERSLSAGHILVTVRIRPTVER